MLNKTNNEFFFHSCNSRDISLVKDEMFYSGWHRLVKLNI